MYRQIVKTGGSEEEITARVAASLEPILSDPDLLSDDQLLVKQEGFTLNQIHIEPDESFSIGAGIWDVGQTTPIHDPWYLGSDRHLPWNGERREFFA